jgi:hypothetical protein
LASCIVGVLFLPAGVTFLAALSLAELAAADKMGLLEAANNPPFHLTGRPMTATDTPTNPEPPRRRRQFTIGGLLMLMVVCSVTAAAGSYLVRSLQRPAGSSRLVFVLFTLVAPVVLLVAVNLIRQAILWLSRRR